MDRYIPYSTDVLLALYSQYNETYWPLQIVAILVGAAALFLAFRPSRQAAPAIALILAAFWAWTGGAFLIAEYAALNWFGAYVGYAFLVQALLFVWTGLSGRLDFAFENRGSKWLGLGLALFALLAFPVLAVQTFYPEAAAPVAGMAPVPTVMFTLGLLLLAVPAAPVYLVAIPSALALLLGVEAVGNDLWIDAVVLIVQSSFVGAYLRTWANAHQSRVS